MEDQHGPVGHHRVEFPLGRAAPLRDVGIVEIVDHDPVAVPHPFGLLADQGVHVLKVRDARTAAVRFPHGVQRSVAVRVDEAGVEMTGEKRGRFSDCWLDAWNIYDEDDNPVKVN